MTDIFNKVISLTVDDVLVTGKIINFIAPEGSKYVKFIMINGEEYIICNPSNINIGNTPNLWTDGAVVSIIINVESKRVYILNSTSATFDIVLMLYDNNWVKESDNIFTNTIANDLNDALHYNFNSDANLIKSTDKPIVDIRIYDTYTTDTDRALEVWSNIYRIDTMDGALKVWYRGATQPTVGFQLQVKVVR